MIYTIFRDNIAILEVKPLDSSELSQKKQSEDIVRLNFVLTEIFDIKVGDYIFFEKTQTKYKLNKRPRIIESPANYQYECIFEGPIHDLKKTKVFLQTGTYKDYKFSLTGNAQTFLLFMIENLNRNGGSYLAGTYKSTSTTTIEFNNWNVFEAIGQISDALGFSWYLDGNTLNFDEKTGSTAYVFQVGRLSGFTELIRTRVESEDIQTVVYGYGSTQNLPARPEYDSSLLTENRLCFAGVDGESKLEKNIDLYGRIEQIIEFDDIKPERTGTVTAISDNVLEFFDSSMDFDINDNLLSGIKPKVSILTGLLMGQIFDVSFDYTTKKYTVDVNTDESGTYPSETIKFAIGDTYTLIDIALPESYKTDAANRLQAATQAYLDEKSQSLDVYEGNIDKGYVQANNIVLDLGDFIRVVSATFAIDNLYEIKELNQSITDPSDYKIKFGDVLSKSLLSLLKSSIFTTKQEIYNIEKNMYTVNEITNQINTTVGAQLEWQSL